jgi:hypothetical protein
MAAAKTTTVTLFTRSRPAQALPRASAARGSDYSGTAGVRLLQRRAAVQAGEDITEILEVMALRRTAAAMQEAAK